VRFDTRMTNIRVAFAGIDGHDAVVELWDGPASSYNDQGSLLHAYRLPMTEQLRIFELVDENVRRPPRVQAAGAPAARLTARAVPPARRTSMSIA
jgi:hypothetical protein